MSTPACVTEFTRLADIARASPDDTQLSDDDLAAVMTAAVRLYAARAEAREALPPPLVASQVTATDVVVTVSEMVRVADINMFDLSMWHSRQRR